MKNEMLRKLIEDKRENSFFFGRVDEKVIKNAEERLGLVFPTDYREFLKEYGCGNIGAIEIFGLGPEIDSVPNVESVIKKLRRARNLSGYLIPIENIGDGVYAVVTSADSSEHGMIEGVVLQWDSQKNEPKRIANNFEEYLLKTLSTNG